jgi:pimeloyl-ACP methyl ester carboxylesterase
LPVLEGGAGPPLLYLGGLLPVAGVDSSLARRTAEVSARPFADIRRVIFANRRPGLALGSTIGAIAAEHAEAIRALDCGPVDVLGVSTGGSIAQQLAAEHPGAIRRLVLVGTGARLSPRTRRMQARVAQHVRAGDRTRALALAAADVVVGGGEPLARVLAPLVWPLARRAGDLSDLAATIEAEDGFDLARCEGTIAAPTLIVAGARDRLYPGPLLDETRRLIPGSVLLVVPRRGHLTVMGDSRVAPAIRAHLEVRGE